MTKKNSLIYLGFTVKVKQKGTAQSFIIKAVRTKLIKFLYFGFAAVVHHFKIRI
jgi:hypothetical protein